jgi:hypothetical protein
MRQRTNNTVKRASPRQRETVMVRIKFLDKETENEGLGFLMSQFSGSTFRSGETIVPPEAAAALAAENFRFKVLGRATHEQMATFRSHVSSSVQRRQNRSQSMAY